MKKGDAPVKEKKSILHYVTETLCALFMILHYVEKTLYALFIIVVLLLFGFVFLFIPPGPDEDLSSYYKRTVLLGLGSLALLVLLGIIVGVIVPKYQARIHTIEGRYEYAVQEDGTAMITKFTPRKEYDKPHTELIIPNKLDGHPVTGIGDGAFKDILEGGYRSKTMSVTIPDGVTSIGNSAFKLCSSLTSVIIPDGVTSIGESAFGYCRSLMSVIIPDSVTSMGVNPFINCDDLTQIIVSPDHPVFATIDGVLFNKSEKKLVCYPHAFAQTSYDIPDGITSIGDYAFYDCSRLTSVIIPDGVTSIGNGAFSSCYRLTSVIIPDGVTSIGDSAFSSCRRLTSVIIPDGVTSIENGAFSHCYSLTSVIIPDGVTSIGDYAFSSCSSLTSVIIPDGVTSIGSGAFSSCFSLTSVSLPDSVTSIGSEAGFVGQMERVTFTVPRGSWAEEWCKKNDWRYRYSEE